MTEDTGGSPASVAAILAELDGNQRAAATAAHNVVVAAGAGSGKTKTLAARYAWLVMERGLKPDNILTLTFTKKAAAEMHTRIYRILADNRSNSRASAALREFEAARIGTIDSFCAAVARASSRLWGVTPEFSTDDAALRESARSAALAFVLEHREERALAVLLAAYNLRGVAEDLFAAAAAHSPLSRPIDFAAALARQKEAVAGELSIITKKIDSALADIKTALAGGGNTDAQYCQNWQAAFETEPDAPDFALIMVSPDGTEEQVKQYVDWLFAACKIRQPGRCGEPLATIKEVHKQIRDECYPALSALANTALQWETAAGIFALLAQFQDEFNRQKREAGILSFNDVAQIACDTLRDDPGIRAYYKRRIRAIMIDEFQDNNALQRDLVFLLAEKDDRCVPGVPAAEDLDSNKLFFVGDEKQSIFRFRGADVSVFRALSRDLAQSVNEQAELSLPYNYRSHPSLIGAFNHIFANVFLPAANGTDFEARHSVITIPETRRGEESAARVHIALLDKARIPKDAGLSSYDLEALYIAQKIRGLFDSRFEIFDKKTKTARACTYADFAVLQRAYSHQGNIEKECKRFGIPFVSTKPQGIFHDAPVNDLCAFLRLAVYPDDRIAYAAALRSPFARLSGDGLTRCLLERGPGCEPFDAAQEAFLSDDDRARFAKARALYAQVKDTTAPVTETLTALWYFAGYRYETLWSAESAIYAELFDMLFEIARLCDERGLGLAGFVDHIDDLIANREKLDLADTADAGESPADDDRSGVKLLSVHASKGMEFPVVFIYGGNAPTPKNRGDALVYFNRDYGPTLKLPQADALPEQHGNFFYRREQEAEAAQEAAELRRLLYVAMTRAESALYFTASINGQTKNEKDIQDLDADEYDDTYIQTRVDLLCQCRAEKAPSTFFDLLLPVIAKTEEMYRPGNSARPFTLSRIPACTYAEAARLAGPARTASSAVRGSPFAAAQAAKARYQAAPLRDAGRLTPEVLNASRLAPPRADAPAAAPPCDEAGSDPVYRLLREAGLSPADFGTITHALIEGRLKNAPPRLPAKAADRGDEALKPVLAEAETLAQRFLDSELGQAARAAPFLESEFSVVTLREQDGANIPVDGVIDLVFEKDGETVVVDFKTDRVETPEDHAAQLAVYRQAAADLFGKPARAYLYYLRSGRLAEA
jgi:ATP-dependent helicase/nuclease subunit A